MEVAAESDKSDRVPLTFELDCIHETAHHGDSPAACLAEVLVSSAVGHGSRLEPGPLVGDGDFGSLGLDLANDGDLFTWITAVPVLDGIDEGFVECKANGEEVLLWVTEGPQGGDDFIPGGRKLAPLRKRKAEFFTVFFLPGHARRSFRKCARLGSARRESKGRLS